MRGYNDGYDACSSEGGRGSSGDGSCYEIGYEDGQDHPFDSEAYDDAVDSLLE